MAGQTPNAAQTPSSGLAIASMVLGIVGLVTICFWYISFPCDVLAIVLGFVAKSKVTAGTGGGKGMAMAGIICGFIGLGLMLFVILLAVAGFAWFAAQAPEILEQIEQDMQDQMEQVPVRERGNLLNLQGFLMDPVVTHMRMRLG